MRTTICAPAATVAPSIRAHTAVKTYFFTWFIELTPEWESFPTVLSNSDVRLCTEVVVESTDCRRQTPSPYLIADQAAETEPAFRRWVAEVKRAASTGSPKSAALNAAVESRSLR